MAIEYGRYVQNSCDPKHLCGYEDNNKFAARFSTKMVVAKLAQMGIF